MAVHVTQHTAYNTLVRSTLEYCSMVWDPYTTTTITNTNDSHSVKRALNECMWSKEG